LDRASLIPWTRLILHEVVGCSTRSIEDGLGLLASYFAVSLAIQLPLIFKMN
jgi:hypothetical protein